MPDPAPATGDQGKYLRGDGTYGTPTNTTYSDATQTAHGLMSVSYTHLDVYKRQNQLSPEGQRVIAGCVLVVAAVGPVFSIISKVSGGVSSLIGIISKMCIRDRCGSMHVWRGSDRRLCQQVIH